MIIAFHGQAQNGKDEAGKILISLANNDGINLKRLAFADQMKILAANSLGIYEDEIEAMNSLKDTKIIRTYITNLVSDWSLGPITGREYLINFGESHRKVFGEDYWAKIAFSNIAPWPDIVVTDLRLEAEAKYLIERGAHIIHIYREENQEDGILPGEQKLPDKYIDYYCDNTGTKEDLKKNLKEIYEDIKKYYEYKPLSGHWYGPNFAR